MKLNEKLGSSSLLKILTVEILQSAPNDPKPTQGIRYQKYPTYVHCSTPSHKRPCRSTISHFQDIAHFRIFPLTLILKFQSAIKYLNFGRSPIYTITFYSLMTILFIIKFGSDPMKTAGGVAFSNVSSHRVSC